MIFFENFFLLVVHYHAAKSGKKKKNEVDLDIISLRNFEGNLPIANLVYILWITLEEVLSPYFLSYHPAKFEKNL